MQHYYCGYAGVYSVSLHGACVRSPDSFLISVDCAGLGWSSCVLSAQVPDFNDMYELYDPCTVMFFFRNKHIMIDLGTGNNNKISWAFNNKQEVRSLTLKPVSYTHLTLPTILLV